MALGPGVPIDKYTLWEALQKLLHSDTVLLIGLHMSNKLYLHPGSTFSNSDGLRQTVLIFPAFLAFLTKKINCAIKRIKNQRNHSTT